MQITDVRVRKVAKEGKLKAVVSITMDEEFVVHDIKVIEVKRELGDDDRRHRNQHHRHRDVPELCKHRGTVNRCRFI